MAETDGTVFVVDDDLSVRKSLLRLIRLGGWHGEAFASAHEFLARPAFPGIGCLILDVRLPDMMGTELCSVMAARHIELPIIFLTGHVDVSTTLNAWNAGGVNFLTKPVDAEALLQAIRQALERHAAAQNDKH